MKKIYSLTIISPNPDGIYRAGEKVNFYPQAMIASTLVLDGRICWKIIKNKMETVADGEFTTDIMAACVSYTADEPCCLECQMTFFAADGADPVTAALGAAVDPFDIRPGLKAPADFDAFWDKQKKRLAAVPLKASLTPVKSGNFDCHDVKIDCVENIPVSGLLVRSVVTYKKKCPAVICLHGAGVKSARPENVFTFVEQDFLALDINAHGLSNLMSPEFYDEKSSTVLAGYACRNFDSGDPGKVYFANMFLRVKRAIDFMASLPEWDGRNLVLFGHSQGGFQCFAGAYLDDRVSVIAAGVPAGCDLGGILAGRSSGWPFGTFSGFDKKLHAPILKAAAYYDNANFASRITVPGMFSVGLIDASCCPSSVYAAYNNYTGPKSILTMPWMPHTAEPAMVRELTKFVIAQARRRHTLRP